MVQFLALKLWTTAVLWVMSFTSTYIPYLVHAKFRKGAGALLMSFCNCLAGGVILGTMLLHVLPTLFLPQFIADPEVSTDFIPIRYPLGPLFAGISFLLLFAVDRLFLSPGGPPHQHHAISLAESALPDIERTVHLDTVSSIEEEDAISEVKASARPRQTQAVVFVLALSLHSFLEGLGLSGIAREPELWSFVVALVSHKWLEAFALGATVLNARFSKRTTFALHLLYSLLTPIGTACIPFIRHLS
jgi:zinc transporter ZupT